MIRKFFDWLEDWTFHEDNIFFMMGRGSLVLAVFVALITIPVGLIINRQPAFTLQKAEWTCTESHEEWHDVPVGKVLVPEQENVCDNWKRK